LGSRPRLVQTLHLLERLAPFLGGPGGLQQQEGGIQLRLYRLFPASRAWIFLIVRIWDATPAWY
jgi:hypothetical protein